VTDLPASSAWPAYLAVTGVLAIAAAARGVWSPCGLSMISAINPFSERSRGHRYWVTACWFVAGAVLGGALLGATVALAAAAWSLLPVPAAGTLAIAAGCCLVALVSDSPAVPAALPNHPRQVNERWLGRYRRWIYAAGFGLQIGSGFATYIMTAAVSLIAVLGVLSGSPVVAMLTGLLFGLVRGLAVLLSGTARDPAALRALHRRLDRLAPWSLRVVMAIEAAAAVLLGGLAAGIAGVVVMLFVIVGGGALAHTRSTRLSAATADAMVTGAVGR